MKRLEEEGTTMKEEIRLLRDWLEEEKFGRRKLEEKLDELVREKDERKREVEEEKAERKKEVEKERAEWKKEVEKEKNERKKEAEKEKEEKRKGEEKEKEERERRAVEDRRSPAEQRDQLGGVERQRRSVVLTDSNGREATPDSVKRHISPEERDKHDVKLHVAYTTEEAFRRVGAGEIDVRNATVIIDNLTNDVRGTRQRQAVSPEELVQRVDQLRERLRAAGATATVVCEIKPMEVLDVSSHNRALHRYLQAQGEWGCPTQIRRSFLQRDGYHLRQQYDAVLDRTYACAIRGIPVPSPTPTEDFVPEIDRRRRDFNWPSLPGNGNRLGQRRGGGNPMNLHGWGW